jgi:hypothetical protein
MFIKSKIYIIIIVLVCLMNTKMNAQVKQNPQMALKQNAVSLNDSIPSRVTYLFKWPDETILSGPNRVSEKTSPLVASVKENCIEWIKRIVNPDWLPKEENYIKDRLIMIKNETDQLDVCRISWAFNDYNIQVSQTFSIMTIKLTPVKNSTVGETFDERISFVKALCRQIFNDTAFRWGTYDPNRGGVNKVPVKNISSKILDYSFRNNLTHRFPDGVVGEAVDKDTEGIKSPRNGIETNAENKPDNSNWDKTASSWGYWWRHVCWMNDGKSIGFFLLKEENGAVKIDYNTTIDNSWFEGLDFKHRGTLTDQ